MALVAKRPLGGRRGLGLGGLGGLARALHGEVFLQAELLSALACLVKPQRPGGGFEGVEL